MKRVTLVSNVKEGLFGKSIKEKQLEKVQMGEELKEEQI